MVLPIYTEETDAKAFRSLARRKGVMPGMLFAEMVKLAKARFA